MLRGCTLKNTDYVLGIVLYNGHYTKVMKNNVHAKEKKSLLEIKMNNYIVMVFVFLILFCLFSSILYIIWVETQGEDHPYLSLGDENTWLVFIKRFFNWILIFGNFVPISLVVTVETVKFL